MPSASTRTSLRLIATALTLTALLSFTGCSHIQLALGIRTSLAKLPVTTMEATLPKDPAIAPGEKSPLVVTFTDATGKTWINQPPFSLDTTLCA